METLLLSNITIRPILDNFLPELDAEELGNLKKEIKNDGGVRDPLVIWKDTAEGIEENVLIDGHNRYRILDQLKKTEAPVIYIKLKDEAAAKEWMLNNQLSRRNLDVFTRVQIALKLEGEIRQRAAERKKKGQFGADATDSQNSDAPEETGTVLEILGKKAKTSKDTVLKIKKILTGIPRLRELVDTEQLSINQAADIVTSFQPEEQDAAINRLLTLGKSDKLEEVDAREPRIKGSTGKTFKLKNSYIQFAEKAGKPDTSNFIIGDDFFQGVCVRGIDGGMQLVQSQYFLNAFSDEKPLMYDEAMTYLKEVQGYISIAHDLINSGKAVEKAEKKVKKAKEVKPEKTVTTEQPKIEQPTKATKANKSTKKEQPTKAVKAKQGKPVTPQIKKSEIAKMEKTQAIKDRITAVVASFQEHEQEEATLILNNLKANQVYNNDERSLRYFVKEEFGKPLTNKYRDIKQIADLPALKPKKSKKAAIQLDPIEKALQLITNEEGDRFNYISENDDSTYESIINELKAEIESCNGTPNQYTMRDILRARLKTPVEASIKAPMYTLTDEDKTAILEYYRNDPRAERSIKSIEDGYNPDNLYIEKVSIGEALRLKRANPDAVLPEIEWKKKKTTPKKAPTPKTATPTPPAVQAILDAQEQLTDAEKQSLIDGTAHMPEKKQIAAIEKP